MSSTAVKMSTTCSLLPDAKVKNSELSLLIIFGCTTVQHKTAEVQKIPSKMVNYKVVCEQKNNLLVKTVITPFWPDNNNSQKKSFKWTLQIKQQLSPSVLVSILPTSNLIRSQYSPRRRSLPSAIWTWPAGGKAENPTPDRLSHMQRRPDCI